MRSWSMHQGLTCPGFYIGHVSIYLSILTESVKSHVSSHEVCESSVIMCPRCDNTCKVWQLSDTCTYAKVTVLSPS